MSVFCSSCDNVHADTRNMEPWRWRCTKVPVPPGYGFVSRDFSPYPPFERCDRLNKDGDCKMFIPQRERSE